MLRRNRHSTVGLLRQGKGVIDGDDEFFVGQGSHIVDGHGGVFLGRSCHAVSVDLVVADRWVRLVEVSAENGHLSNCSGTGQRAAGWGLYSPPCL